MTGKTLQKTLIYNTGSKKKLIFKVAPSKAIYKYKAHEYSAIILNL